MVIKAEQKEIIQNVLERKDSMAECCQWASERACVTSPFFGQGTTSFFFLMVICNSLLGQHISTFRGYRILFSIRNPYINRFTNHFSIHS
jgi:hypothetical protein